MTVIGTNDIIELNKRLGSEGLPFKIHLRDACGKQSCWIEETGAASEAEGDRMRDATIAFFSKLRVPVEFDEEGLAFWVG
ncbi:MAG: hypothetical protein WAY93_08115 [Atopobiaceae bacterium]|jgi:hypothetical protein|nr:hypothetical protein [Atopobiaceae bacterium]